MITPTLYYRYKYDAFTEIQRYINDTTMLTTFANLDNNQSAGMEIVFSGYLKSYFSVDLSGNIFHDVIDASSLGFSDRKSTTSWNAKLAANLRPAKSSVIQINAYYRSTRLTPQGRYDPLFLVNIGFRQDLFEDKVSLTATSSDVFNALTWKSHIDTDVLYESSEYKRNSQIIYIGLVYHFGGGQSESDKELQFEDKI